MKFLQVLVPILKRAANNGVCLTSDEIFESLGKDLIRSWRAWRGTREFVVFETAGALSPDGDEAEDPAIRFWASGQLEHSISIGKVREAEGFDHKKVYYLTRDEKDLVRRKVLSENVHVNVMAPDGHGGIAAARVDRGHVDPKIWAALIENEGETIRLMARRGRLESG